MGVSYPDRYVLPPHAHPWGQLIYAVRGTMQVMTGNTLWLVPPTRALWAPAGVTHAIEMRGETAMRTIYVPVERGRELPGSCHALEVGPLLREVILHIVGLRMVHADAPAQLRIAQVFLDLVAASEHLPLFVPMPHDARAGAVARALQADPSREESVEDLARDAGASVRTLQRIFREETGMRLVEWRQRLRLLQAITLLEQGASVTAAGAQAGYASTSAFIAAFKQQMGETPGRFAKART